MFTCSRPITALLMGGLAVKRHGPGDLTRFSACHIYQVEAEVLFIHWLVVLGPQGILTRCT